MGAQERRVEREIVVDADPSQVWEALTDARLLGEWMAEEAELETVPGGRASFRFADGEEREGAVLEVEEERYLSFSWTRPSESPSLVEFELQQVAGGTRLVVVERAPAAVGASAGAEWTRRLRAFVEALSLVAA